MKYIGGRQAGEGWGAGGGGVGVWGGWEVEDGHHHPQGGKQQCYVLSRAQKLPQSTRQDETVGLTPQAALLEPISGPIDPAYSGSSWFYMVGKRSPVKADLAIRL